MFPVRPDRPVSRRRPRPTARDRRPRAAAGAAVLLLGGSLLLSACGNNGLTLARQACVHVDASLSLYEKSLRDANPTRAADQVRKATEQLELALPLAAQANSADPQWNPLMTTLQEIGRNSEANLVTALQAQCTQAAQPNEQAPIVGGTPTTGPTPTPTSTTASTAPSTTPTPGHTPNASTHPTPSTLPGQ